MINKSMLGLLLALSFSGCANTVIGSDDVLYIYDGDTFTIKCLDGFQCNNKGNISLRVKGVDTSELKGSCDYEISLARKAKQHTVSLLRNATSIKLNYDNSRLYDRYGRLLAYVEINGVDLGESLIKAGLGRSYNGGKRNGWCN